MMLRRVESHYTTSQPWWTVATLLLGLLITPAANSEGTLEAVHAFLAERASEVGNNVSVTVQPPRAELPACNNPEPFLPNVSASPIGRVSVGVRCNDAGRVRYLRANVQATGRYVQVAERIEAGEMVTVRHLSEQQGDLSRLPDQAILDPATAIGQEATRPLAVGLKLQAHHLRRPRLVKRGQRVVIEIRGNGFRVRREAQAMEAGGKGESVRVRLDDREMLRARVTGHARLTVE